MCPSNFGCTTVSQAEVIRKIDPTRSEEVAIVEELAAGVVAVLLPSHSG